MKADIKTINGIIISRGEIKYNIVFDNKKEFDIFKSSELDRMKKEYNEKTEIYFIYKSKYV